MNDGQSLYQQWLYDRTELRKAIDQARKSAVESAHAEAEYYAAKHDKAVEMRLDHMPVTYIQTIVKGCDGVVGKLEEYELKQELHRVDMRVIDVLKDDCKMVYDQMRKEDYGQ